MNKNKLDEYKNVLNVIYMILRHQHGSLTEMRLDDEEVYEYLKFSGRAFAISKKRPKCIMFLFGFDLSDQTKELIKKMTTIYDIHVYIEDHEVEL